MHVMGIVKVACRSLFWDKEMPHSPNKKRKLYLQAGVRAFLHFLRRNGWFLYSECNME
jgi:hypothetical protein